MTLLNDYSQDLLSNLGKFQELGDKTGSEMIRSCCLNCFAHLVVLCEALGKTEPGSQVGVDTSCDSGLERLGGLCQGMNTDEYTRHDLLLRVGGTFSNNNGYVKIADTECYLGIIGKGSGSI